MVDYKQQPIDGGSGIGFNLREFVTVLFRRKFVILALWLPLVVVAAMTALNQVGVFTAASRVLLQLASPESQGLGRTAMVSDYDIAMSTYSSLAVSLPVAMEVKEALQDSIPVFESIDPIYANLYDQGAMLEFILRNLEVSRVADSKLMEVRFSDPYPRIALAVNGSVQTAFLDHAAGIGRQVKAVAYYEEQFAAMRASLDSLLVKKTDVIARTGVSDFDQDSGTLQTVYNSLLQQRYTGVMNVNSRRAVYESIRLAVAADPDFVPIISESHNLSNLRASLDAEKLALDQLQARHPAGSPPVLRQIEVVENLRAHARTAVRDYLRALEFEIGGYESSIATIENQMSEVTVQLDQVPGAFRDLALLDAQIEVTSRTLLDIQRRLADVRISAMGGHKTNRLMKVTDPEIVGVTSASRRIVLFVLITLIGFVCAFVVGLIIDRSDTKIRNVTAMSKVVDIPALGAVSQGKK